MGNKGVFTFNYPIEVTSTLGLFAMHFPGTNTVSFYGINSEVNYFYGRCACTEGSTPTYDNGWHLFILEIGYI